MTDETGETVGAFERFAEVWGDGLLIDEVAHALNCAETRALAGVFTAVGRPGDAKAWTQAHVETESECDGDHDTEAGK